MIDDPSIRDQDQIRQDRICSLAVDMLSPPDAIRLNERGWVELHGAVGDDPERSLLALAGTLGEVVPSRPRSDLIDRLRPARAESARLPSLSRRYGTGAFPLHTDTAHWPTPARYILVVCLHPGRLRRGTLLVQFPSLQFNRQEEVVLRSGVFLVRNARASWYSTVLSSERPYVRFDPGCMVPATADGHEASRILQERIAASFPTRIDWTRGKLVILDNWRLLHGREAAEGDEDRVLLRVLVMAGRG